MNERVTVGVRTVGLVVLAAVFFACAPEAVQAQTTVVLDAPGSESIDTMVRGGSYASSNYGNATLATRASSDESYVRRALMKFDTETRIPARATIASAHLTLTVKDSNSESRRLAAYRIVYSFDEGVANWYRRKSGINWSSRGGDLGSKYAEATVSPSVGSKVTFDVTRLVQEAVNGNYGSRWTRIAVLDPGSSSGGSWREYYSSETSTASLRPTLTVVYGGSTSSTTGTASSPSTSTSTSLSSGWSTRDIGSVGRAGRASGTTSSFTLEGSGDDVWGSSDAFRFVYRTLSGDGSIVTRVAGLERVDSWTKAGVMMRESLSANSRHAFMLVSPGKGLAFQRRTSTGGSSYHTSGGSGAAPYWVKLTRSGSTFTAYKSTNGTSWTRVGSQSISMGSTIYVGVAVSSHVSGTLATANFASTAVAAGAVSAPSEPAESTDDEPAYTPPTTSTPPPTSSTTTGSTLRVLHWNVHHGGVGTDGRFDPARIGAWIAKMNPHVASLNEVDTTSHVSSIVSALQSKSGVRWYTYFSGRGNLVISRLPLEDTSKCLYAPSYSAYAPHLNIMFNGRRINIWSTHLHVSSASARLAETKALQYCASHWPEARIVAGDYNMQYGSTEYKQAASNYTDAWLAAKALGTTSNYSGNCDGCTRNSRIDYVFSSKGATFLKVKSAQIVDTRDSNGKMPSDHKPMVVTYTVN